MKAGQAGSGMPVLAGQVDNEFFPSLANSLLLADSDVSSDSSHSDIITPAYGHLLKALSSGVLGWNKELWTKEIMESLQVNSHWP